MKLRALLKMKKFIASIMMLTVEHCATATQKISGLLQIQLKAAASGHLNMCLHHCLFVCCLFLVTNQ